MNTFWKRVLTVILGALFVVAFIALLAGIVVRRDLLNPALYTAPLADNDVYERIYVDVFSDQALQDQLAASLGIESNLLAGETYAELVSVFNLILPPSRIQNAVESFAVGLTDYLAGRTPELPPDLPLDELADHQLLAQRFTDAFVAAAVQNGAASLPVLAAGRPLSEEELIVYLDAVSNGRVESIPTSLLEMSVADLTPTEQDALIDRMLAPVAGEVEEAVRRQMKAALAEDDLSSATVIAVRARLAERIEAGAVRLEARIAQSGILNTLGQTATTLDTTGETLIASLNLVRGYASVVQNLLVVLAVTLAVLLGLIVWINGSSLKSMLAAAGWPLVIAGGLVLLAWLLFGFWLRDTLVGALAANPGMPAGVDGIVDDVAGSFTRTLWESIWGTAVFFFGLGLVLILVRYIRPLTQSLSRLLSPIWAHKGWVLGGLLAVFVLIPLLVALFSPTARAARLACNGYVELCDRPANEVAYVATHNAMSISDYGWLWPSHDGSVADQLDAGVRALLIDTHYADTAKTIDETISQLPPEAQEVARDAFASGDFSASGQDAYLCHMACGLGARILADTLAEIAAFLQSNPREVLFLIIQDAVSADDTARALAAAGLDQYIYDHPAGAPWPTLGEMVNAGQRLVVMAEEGGPPPSWYQNVWDSTMETPYTFINYGDFSCAANRGGDDKPFFLLNHWIQRGSPNRVDASIVNEYDFLLSRARQCEAERGKMPNFIAVNFYQNGDVFAVVHTLNGIDQ